MPKNKDPSNSNPGYNNSGNNNTGYNNPGYNNSVYHDIRPVAVNSTIIQSTAGLSGDEHRGDGY